MSAGRPSFAVIGTGAAALGVLDALLAPGRDVAVTVFDIGDVPRAEPPCPVDPGEFYDGIYAGLRASGLRGFPPPKTHLGAHLPLHSGTTRLIRSQSFGGLTNYWGATMLPFTRAELLDWPIGTAVLAPHYARIAEIAGIAGGADALDRYFGSAHVNRPAIPVTPSLSRLAAGVAKGVSGGPGDGYRILPGTNRCAIETRAGAQRSCTACGECLAGCYRGAVYSARHTLSGLLSDPRVTQVSARVLRVDPVRRSVHLADGSAATGFARVFLAAGCLGTTEILMRSAGIAASGPLLTNSVHVFPILNTGRGDGGTQGHVGLANLILACLPDGHGAPMAQAQIYPNADYLWRTQVPPALWRALRGLVGASRARLFWGRLFVHSSQSQTYRVTLRDDALAIAEASPPDRSEPARVLKSLRRAVSGGGFHVLRRPVVVNRSSAHYGGTFAYGNGILPVATTGEVFPRVHVCDSTVFPDMPAVSPTFTIMANARRTATEALDA